MEDGGQKKLKPTPTPICQLPTSISAPPSLVSSASANAARPPRSSGLFPRRAGGRACRAARPCRRTSPPDSRARRALEPVAKFAWPHFSRSGTRMKHRFGDDRANAEAVKYGSTRGRGGNSVGEREIRLATQSMDRLIVLRLFHATNFYNYRWGACRLD